MGRVRFTVVTVDCDSSDTVLLEQLRSLMPGVAVTTPAPAKPDLAPEGPSAADPTETCPAFPPCLGCRRGGPCVGIVNVDKPANPDLSAAASELGRRGGVKGGAERARRMTREERSAAAKEAAVKRWARARGEDVDAALERHRRGETPARPRTESLIRQHLVEQEALASSRLDGETRVLEAEPEPAIDVGKVAGVAAPAIAPGSLNERIVQAITAKPGVAVADLARELLGDASAANVRRIDMLTGPLVMSGRLARYNGRLYSDMRQAAAMKLPPPQQRHDLRRPGEGQAPLAKVQTTKALYDAIVAAFTEDVATPLPDLARELLGESTGRSLDKLQLMLRQLCASGRLKALGNGRYRAIGEHERAAEESDESDREDDDDDDAGDEPELESNGQPDDDRLEELDLS